MNSDKWTKRTKKLMLYIALQPRDDIDYVSRKEGGGLLVNIENCVDTTIQRRLE